MKKITLLFSFLWLFTLWSQQGQAQQGAGSRESTGRYSVSGYIRDAETGESLIGANLYNEKTGEGTTTNTYGFFSISLKPDSVFLRFSYVGYQGQRILMALHKDTTLHVQLMPANRLQEVVVSADRPIEENTQMSRIDIPIAQIKSMPALLGEVDVMKVLQLLPGVQSGSEGSSGLYVRGGGPDQNLILLDGVPVYNASHLFGFFSVFNADAINRVELIKGGFPARYGGRLSSVIDISMKEGNMKEFHGEGGIGLISSRLTLEGPIKKDVSSFIISGRRTYMDLVFGPVIRAVASADGEDVNMGYYFYDLNGKVNYKFSERDRLYISAYMGDDRAKMRFYDEYGSGNWQDNFEARAGLNWGNITTAMRWNHILNQQLFSNTTLTYSRYRFNIFQSYKEERGNIGEIETQEFNANYLSGIRDIALKTDFDYLPNPQHFIRAGSNGIYHTFETGAMAFNTNEINGDTLIGNAPTTALEHALYVEDDYKVSEHMKVNAGLHFSGFAVKGQYYPSLQPRLSARYLLSQDLSVKASFANMAQFIHLLTNSGIGLPTDLWVPTTDRIKPQRSSQAALGFAKTIRQDYELSVEGYYKKMDNLIEYKEGASFLDFEKSWEEQVTAGQGWSYGGEFFLQKKTGKTTGWLGYTLSWSNRQFDELNKGKIFPYKYDRRHDISLSVVHKFNARTELSSTWVFGTGNAITLPINAYNSLPDIAQNPMENNPYVGWNSISDFSDRNEYRMANYHRLDIGISRFKKTKWGERRWVYGIYNAYNRANPFFMDIARQRDGTKKYMQYSLFQIIPSISYNFSF